MSKIILNSVGSLLDATTAQTTINTNNTTIQNAWDNTLSRDGTSPNQMSSSIDMNSNRVLNLPNPISDEEPLRLVDLNTFVGGGAISTIPSGGAVNTVLTKNSATNYDVAWTAPQGLSFTRLAKTANYTVLNADKGLNISLGGTAFYTLTFTTTSDYDANFAVAVTNTDSSRGKTIACSGLTSFILWPKQSCIIYRNNNTWYILGQPPRWKATGNLTFFCDASLGSDSNDGLAAGTGGAFQTLNGAMNVFGKFIEPSWTGAPQITLNLANGTYSGGLHWPGVLPGGSGNAAISIVGNTTTPTNVIILGGIATFDGAFIEISGLSIDDSATGFCISTATNSIVRIIGNINLGAVSAGGTQMFMSSAGKIICDSGTITVSASTPSGDGYFINCQDPACLCAFAGRTFSFTADMGFTTVVYSQNGAMVEVNGTTWNLNGHTITGQRYNVGSLGGIVGTGSTTLIPGSTGGSGTNPGASPYGLYT